MQPHRRRVPGYGVMLLAYQLFGVIGIEHVPPVTLSLVGLQVAIFLRLFKLPWYKASDVCISFYNVFYKREYKRLIFGAFEHADDWHLYYNMVSFVLKGQSLERRFGSLKFLYITSVFTVLTNLLYVALGRLAGEIDHTYELQCAVGFSGVIFALKVLTTHYNPSYSHHLMGVPILVPAKYAVWAELFLIQLLVPNASFIGHLSGVLVGVAYCMGPLSFLMDAVYSVLMAFLNPRAPSFQQPPRRFPPRAEATGYSEAHYSQYVPSGMSEEEQLRQAMQASLDENFPRHQFDAEPSSPSYSASDGDVPHAPPPGFVPDLPEVRNRRLERFQ